MKNIFFKRFIIVLGLILVFACKNEDNNALKVGLSANFSPFESNENGKLVGFDIDLAKELGKRIGKKVVFKTMDFNTLLTALQDEKIDVVISAMNITEERKKVANFTRGYFFNPAVLIVKDGDYNIKGIESLVGKKVATTIKTEEDSFVDGLDGVENIKLKNSSDTIFYLTSGKVDAVVLNRIVAKKIMKDNNGAMIVDGVELNGAEMGIAINKKNSQLLNNLNKALMDAKRDGFIKNLYNKYIKK